MRADSTQENGAYVWGRVRSQLVGRDWDYVEMSLVMRQVFIAGQ
jgi:hypothetical protein